MKERVLEALLERKGEYLSGEALCRDLGVTRAAVWKAVETLRAEGFVIEAAPRRGYRLVGEPDLVTAAAVTSRLTTARLGRTLELLNETDSTNRLCRARARDGAVEGLVVAAEHQTGGRGRSGRGWSSSPRTALQFSLLLRPSVPPIRAALITQMAAAAVALALEGWGVTVAIKWPNDLLLDGRKVCGILTEMSCELDHVEWIVMGLGLNVSQPSFDDELSSRATSLALATGQSFDRSALLASILNRLEPLYDRGLNDPAEALAICRERSALIGREIVFEDEQGRSCRAVARAVDERGRLVVETPDGAVHRLLSGEVHIGAL